MLNLAREAALNDAAAIARGRRLIVWGGVFACLALQAVALAAYAALFGEAYFAGPLN